MKNINQFLLENINNDLSNYTSTVIDESLRDLWNIAKSAFKKIWQYAKKVITKAGSYIFTIITENGEAVALPAISGLTPAQAYSDNNIDKTNTLVVTDTIGSKITGLTTKIEDCLKLYKKEDLNPEKYLMNFLLNQISESAINEVKLAHNDPYAGATVVDNETLKDTIIENIFAQRDGGARLLIWGAPGIGKTAILQEVVNTIRKDIIPRSQTSNGESYNFIVKTLSNETPDNFTLPAYNDESIKFTGGRTAIDLPKTWLPVYLPSSDPEEDKMRSDACGEGLLFLDELSRATPQVLNVILPLINEGKFNGYNLGKGWAIIAASNRMEDEDSGQSELSNALVNRFAQIHYEPTVKAWAAWADKQKFMSPLLTYWLGLDSSNNNYAGSKYFYYDPNESDSSADVTKLMCSPRAWTNAIKALARWEYGLENPSDKWGRNSAGKLNLQGTKILDLIYKDKQKFEYILSQYIPSNAVSAFIGFLTMITQVGDIDTLAESIWKNNGIAMKKVKIDILDAAIIPVIQCTLSQKLGSGKLPTEKEFLSFCNWIVSLKQPQYFSLAFKAFMATFFEAISNEDESIISILFTWPLYLQEKKKELGKNFDLNKESAIWAPVFKRWHTTPDKFPNYQSGLEVIIDYANHNAEFKNALQTVIGDTAVFDIA